MLQQAHLDFSHRPTTSITTSRKKVAQRNRLEGVIGLPTATVDMAIPRGKKGANPKQPHMEKGGGRCLVRRGVLIPWVATREGGDALLS